MDIRIFFMAAAVVIVSIACTGTKQETKETHIHVVEEIQVDGTYVRKFHDDSEGNTCYLLGNSISCVADHF